jgi:hypothetical protein
MSVGGAKDALGPEYLVHAEVCCALFLAAAIACGKELSQQIAGRPVRVGFP